MHCWLKTNPVGLQKVIMSIFAHIKPTCIACWLDWWCRGWRPSWPGAGPGPGWLGWGLDTWWDFSQHTSWSRLPSCSGKTEVTGHFPLYLGWRKRWRFRKWDLEIFSQFPDKIRQKVGKFKLNWWRWCWQGCNGNGAVTCSSAAGIRRSASCSSSWSGVRLWRSPGRTC